VNESTVLLVGDLAWPVVVLVISVIVLITQRAAVSGLISRISKIPTPLGDVVAEKGVAAISSAVESLSRDVTVPAEPGKRPGDNGVIEPVQNREPIGEIEPLPAEEVTSLVVLRAQAASFLEELAYPPPPGGFGRVSATLGILRRRGVLDSDQTTALEQLIEIADEAARGAVVTRPVAQAVRNSGQAILIQLDKLRAVAAAKFEDHVLDTLRQRLPRGWTLDIDRWVPRDEASAESARARVDALVTARDRAVVVEVRARLRPGADGQIEAVREWLAALPPEIPVLLVMLGERLTDRELSWIRTGHEGPVRLLLWDREAGDLVMTLRELLEQSVVMTGLPIQRTAG
jgi:hypothetical protein